MGGGGRRMKRRDGHVAQGHARAGLTAMWCANTSNFLPASRLERMNASSHPAADGRLSPPAQSSSPPSDAFDALARPTFSHSLWWSQKACRPFGRTARSSASLSSASARSSRHFAEIETGTICRARAGEASVSGLMTGRLGRTRASAVGAAHLPPLRREIEPDTRALLRASDHQRRVQERAQLGGPLAHLALVVPLALVPDARGGAVSTAEHRLGGERGGAEQAELRVDRDRLAHHRCARQKQHASRRPGARGGRARRRARLRAAAEARRRECRRGERGAGELGDRSVHLGARGRGRQA